MPCYKDVQGLIRLREVSPSHKVMLPGEAANDTAFWLAAPTITVTLEVEVTRNQFCNSCGATAALSPYPDSTNFGHFCSMQRFWRQNRNGIPSLACFRSEIQPKGCRIIPIYLIKVENGIVWKFVLP
mmetsp:Transcript_88749/g.236241  ORF Transcript_88749/g.236241 Transcript_88749/m.236241 type:complete len:127 (-) Transcript_88749:501-881(-)